MRYRAEEFASGMAQPVGDDLTVFTAVIGLFAGVLLTYAAKRGKQQWLLFWGGGLVLASVMYLVAIVLGYN
ncbi:MAG: hypothetical protein OEZ39_07335 [Gammaproteobacteria bacterium]|nr:hypothetical protein [Gammaproteobacteria bacterium]MDH5651671.1 hypothetical protein [Gammaproteobacteria bacterium]